MQVESKKTFATGFVLNEAELRRIGDDILNQFEKLSEYNAPIISYKIKFKNGAIAKIASLEEVLSQENLGSSQIIRLSISYVAKNDTDEDVKVSVAFRNADQDDESGYTSMQYSILGNSRDWVFITSTLLEERLVRIKRFAPNQLGEGGSRRSPFRVFLPLIMTLLIVIPMAIFMEGSKNNENASIGMNLEAAYKAGDIENATEALIYIEKEREKHKLENKELSIDKAMPLLFGFGFLIALILIWQFFIRYYLVYVFNWGDYSGYFDKSESTRKFVLIVIVVGVLVSFVGGKLANIY
ncbi:hypothetical protein N473_07130 [Pseudoalteromonas luteoviolacea CPMOR-1]|uniref:Uncharacterized protein n=1 Tax=Pseudoalteromonas luteoviolacea CPMOR-1 TaxID=1365248 RepID=A0A167NFS5_9GAMM|nr:hypothetical protein [Pseudoalteromonas luteoviolacea]KZN68189.1 hypothetical protein N473_07130 [Pseudoalteromonas luteoviolacea CPMOR-1]